MEIGIPKWPGESRIVVWEADGTFLCVAGEDAPFAHNDPAGAQESARRRKVKGGVVVGLRGNIEKLDGGVLLAEETSHAAPQATPRRAAVVGFDPNQTQAGKALAEAPAAQRYREEQRREAISDAAAAAREELSARLRQRAAAGG